MLKNWSVSLSVKTVKVWFFLDFKARFRSKLLDLSNLNFVTKILKRCKIWTDEKRKLTSTEELNLKKKD